MKKMLTWLLLAASGWADPPKPYQPQLQEVQIPKPVEIPAPPQAPALPPMGLNEVVKMALARQSTLEAARQQTEAARGRDEQAAAGLRPHIAINGTYTQPLYTAANFPGAEGGATAFFNPSGLTYSVGINQLIFDFGHTADLKGQTEELVKAAQANFMKAQNDLVLQVKQAYFQVIQNRYLVKVQEDNVGNRQVHLEQARARFTAGLGLPSDVTRAQTALSSAVFNLSQAQTNFGTARLNLNLLLGIDPRTPLEIKDEGEPELATDKPQELFDRALARRQEMIQATANVEAARYALSAAETTSAPTVSTNLGYNDRSVPSITTVNLVFSIGFNVYDGGLQDGRVREAQANLKVAESQRETAKQNVLNDVGQAYLNLKTSEQRVVSATAEEANAKESLRLAEGRYRAGLGLFLDLLDAQSAFLTAETNRISAIAQMHGSRAALLRALGEAPLPLDPAAEEGEYPPGTPGAPGQPASPTNTTPPPEPLVPTVAPPVAPPPPAPRSGELPFRNGGGGWPAPTRDWRPLLRLRPPARLRPAFPARCLPAGGGRRPPGWLGRPACRRPRWRSVGRW